MRHATSASLVATLAVAFSATACNDSSGADRYADAFPLFGDLTEESFDAACRAFRAKQEFDPFVRYHTFGDSAIGFSAILRVGQFRDRYLVTHEFLKRLKDRYDREGIEIPFPQRVLHGMLEVRGAPSGGTSVRSLVDAGECPP